ncbi:acyloxyacyl hydrolase [Brucella sp. IR073]|uniref:acyloxyacyl hydrolase n=1 Tax=unclassified Brucella TaxID=2632610 RepID=UPI003B97FC5E
MLIRHFLCAFIPVSLLLPSSALAGDLFDTSRFGQIGKYADRQEVRLGVMAYDRGLFSTDDYDGVVVNGEFLFKSPDFLDGIGSPRPYIGFDAAIADDPVHFFYTGLNWDFQLTEKLYLTTSLGGAVTTANNLHDPTTYKALGCRVLFHLGAGLGYDLTDNWTAQLYTDHFSNANLCDENNGAEATGIRLGYRF